jgi:hypothetical protein
MLVVVLNCCVIDTNEARRLVVNDTEARTVGDIYRRYLALKSVRALADELAAAGIRSKRRVRSDGTEYGGHRLRHFLPLRHGQVWSILTTLRNAGHAGSLVSRGASSFCDRTARRRALSLGFLPRVSHRTTTSRDILRPWLCRSSAHSLGVMRLQVLSAGAAMRMLPGPIPVQ